MTAPGRRRAILKAIKERVTGEGQLEHDLITKVLSKEEAMMSEREREKHMAIYMPSAASISPMATSSDSPSAIQVVPTAGSPRLVYPTSTSGCVSPLLLSSSSLLPPSPLSFSPPDSPSLTYSSPSMGVATSSKPRARSSGSTMAQKPTDLRRPRSMSNGTLALSPEPSSSNSDTPPSFQRGASPRPRYTPAPMPLSRPSRRPAHLLPTRPQQQRQRPLEQQQQLLRPHRRQHGFLEVLENSPVVREFIDLINWLVHTNRGNDISVNFILSSILVVLALYVAMVALQAFFATLHTFLKILIAILRIFGKL